MRGRTSEPSERPTCCPAFRPPKLDQRAKDWFAGTTPCPVPRGRVGPCSASHCHLGRRSIMERPARRMTLRQLMTHSEKCSRDLIEHFNATLLPRVSDFRDLSRPVRRKSNYPTMI